MTETGDSVVTSPWRLGSLCSGYGGLDLAVEAVLDVRPVWVCEYDPAPSSVLARRFPGVPNLHDITILDWQQVPPVDVLTAGYPCQPFSHAGHRKGTDDERHLWPYIAECVRVLRPRFVVLENVAGHLDLGFDTVLADLVAVGFDAEWCVVRASDVGACHQRARLFIVAADARSGEPERRGGSRQLGAATPGAEGAPREWQRVRDAAGDRGADAPDPGGDGLVRSAELDGAPAAGLDRPRRGHADRRPLETAPAGPRGTRPAPSDTHGEGPQGGEPATGRKVPAWGGSWGEYDPAIDRHVRALGRRAPAPVDDKGRLSPAFVEWMMMLPEGWVTDVLTSRTKALKCLGNGVVPPQAAYAISGLLGRLSERQAA